MKKQLMILLLSLTLMGLRSSAQVTDTLGYLQTEVEQKKNLYIGFPFSKLLTDLQIQPVSIYGGISHKDKYVEPYTQFFYSVGSPIGSHYIYIEWFDSIPKTVTRPLQKNNNWMFSNDVRNYYSGKIVKDIVVR